MIYKNITHDRKFALANGLIVYLGKMCKHGHLGIKYSKSGKCVTCASFQSKSESKKEYDKNRYLENTDFAKERRLNYYYLNKEKENEYSKNYAQENPDKIKLIKFNYKSKRRVIEKEGIVFSELTKWASKQNKTCYWCNVNCDKNYHIDHYYPLSKGGKHEVENLVISCPKCNLTKSAKDPLVFAKQIGRLV